MQCEDIQEQLSAYLEDELEAGARRVIEDHLRQCAGCRTELTLLRRTVATLRSLEELEAPPRLAAAVDRRLLTRGSSPWERLTSWLFFPLHVKVPLQAVALLLVSLGVVYLYRSAPELAEAPRPSVASESASRDLHATGPASAPEEADRLDRAARTRPAEEPAGRAEGQAEMRKERTMQEQESAGARAPRFRQEAPAAAKPHTAIETQEKREAFGDTADDARALRKQAPVGATSASPSAEVILKTSDPARAIVKIREIVGALEGTVDEKEEGTLIVTIPAKASARFFSGLKDLGTLASPPAESPSAPSSEGPVTLSIRLIP
jgi:hypothetical protein